MYFFIIMVLSLKKLTINKYTSYIPTVLEQCGPQAFHWKGKWFSLQERFNIAGLSVCGKVVLKLMFVEQCIRNWACGWWSLVGNPEIYISLFYQVSGARIGNDLFVELVLISVSDILGVLTSGWSEFEVLLTSGRSNKFT
jgi:hypothetical protein